MRGAALLLLLAVACRPYDSVLCLPCEGGCGFGLECVQNVCVSPAERCGILEERPPCGGPCGGGLECFEDRCRPPIEVAAGGDHGCVRWPSGRVSCWGFNDFGQAGPGAVHVVDPQLIPGLDDAVALSLGDKFSCALRADQSGVCWGNNDFGQLGNFSYEFGRDLFRSEPTPQPVTIDRPILQIAAGNRTACALDVDGHIWCWGAGAHSRCLLGDGLAENTQLPLQISSDIAFDRISIGESHGLALAGDVMFGWGSDQLGQIQNGGADACRPVPIAGVSATGIGAGKRLSCAITTAGAAHCAGTDSLGSLPAERPLSFDEPAIEIQTSGSIVCAQLQSGRVVCWGDNAFGQLGHLGVEEVGSGGPPTIIGGSDGAAGFSISDRFGCLLGQGEVRCWGSGADGQLGGEILATRRAERFHEGAFLDVAVGGDHTCAIDADHRVLCWGMNLYGGAGSGARSYVEPPAILEGIDAIDIVSGNHFSCALDRMRRVYCWGRYDRAVHNFPDPSLLLEPTLVTGADGAEQISAANEVACVVIGGGSEVRCWGFAINGLITMTPEYRIHLAARTLPGITGVAKISVGFSSACVLHHDDRATCWGELEFDAIVPGAVDVETGANFACFRLEDGTVSCTGDNQHGELGRGSTRSFGSLGPVRALGPVEELDNELLHTCARKLGDEIWCWGQDNHAGRLGLGPSHDHPSPVRVPDLNATNLRSLSVGREAACVIADDGLWCWGRDVGQLSGVAPVAADPIRLENLP